MASCRGPHRAQFAFVSAALIVLAVNTLCVALQLAPYLPSFLTMVLVAKLAFVKESRPDERPPEESMPAAGKTP